MNQTDVDGLESPWVEVRGGGGSLPLGHPRVRCGSIRGPLQKRD